MARTLLFRALYGVLALTLCVPPCAAAAQAEDPSVVPGTYSFHSPDPFAAGDAMVNLHLTLSPDGSAHVEQASATGGQDPFTADGRWTARGDEVRLVLDYANGEPIPEPDRYTIQFADGFPAELTYAHGQTPEPFGVLAFSLGSGDVHPLVPRLNQMLAQADQVDFRDPGPNVQRFGEYTRRAVVQFQSTHGLTPTGLVDLRTWRTLHAATAQQEPEPVEAEASYTMARARSAQTAGEPIYFTFDDGPSPSWTPPVLDVLARYGAKATFFMVGQEIDQYPDVVRDVVESGHYVADHTWDHQSLEGVSEAEFVESVDSTRDALVSTASDLFTLDGTVAYVRPPYGATDESTRAYAADLGMTMVMWDVDTMDWREPGAQQIATYVLDNAYPGAIVLMHDGGGDRSQTVTALETILPELAAQGYRFPTIYEGDPTAKPAPPSTNSPPTTPPAPAPPPNPNAWHVAGTGGAGANVREEPSTSARVVGTLPDGAEVVPLEGPVDGDGMKWLKVRSTTNLQGWVAADLLQAPSKGSTALRPSITPPSGPRWVVAGTDGAGANLRARPSTKAEVVAELLEGTPVEPLEGPISAEGMLWRKVRAAGSEGWIVASYVRPG
jgi:peptidoglycan/xylan/chitin deacetylase (PgdA/CDA1 family)/uncharacterized protein YraI